ncbi:hypothetical protein BJX61DRAFT_545622 [Aspergillus egyptiacus]|nr:hypothetical protein BJX61DRAFT_545622 [Aspergillus egyptiacus]
MPGQTAPAFQPSSSRSASHTLPSSSSDLYSADRATPLLADSSSCDALGLWPQPTETSSVESSSRFHSRDMATEGDGYRGRTGAAGPQEQSLERAFEHGLRHPQFLDDGADRDDAQSALMAVPHYSDATNNGSRISASEVVSAVVESGDFFRQPIGPTQGVPVSRISPPAELYMSDSEMTDVLSDLGGVALDGYQLGGMGMAELAGQLVRGSTTQDNYLEISDATDDDSATDILMEYEPRNIGDDRLSFTSLEDDDDTRKFYLDHNADESDIDSQHSSDDDRRSRLSGVDLADLYQGTNRGFGTQEAESDPASTHEDHTNFFSEAEAVNGDPAAVPHFADNVTQNTTQESNFTIDQFITQWLYQSSTASVPMMSLSQPMLPRNLLSNIIQWIPPAKITRPSGYTGDFYDIQQIPWWEKLRVKRADARQLRDQWYRPYYNLHYGRQPGARLPEEEFYFQGKSMYTAHKATIEHFQLRNLMSVPSYNTVHFAHESKMYSWVPGYDDLQCLIDLSVPTVESGFQGPVKISTMKSAVGVSVAGGFSGEYAFRAANTEGRGAEGYVTKDQNGITNHIDIIASRTNRSPIGVFASNDSHVRILDCETNTFVADFELTHPVNCTSTAPDGRLRAIVGDSQDAWVVEAESGRQVHALSGHHDYGFACAWSPDMMHIATSNQDETVIIWDARMWRMLEKIESDVAGYRSLRFSPVGGGPRTLLMCEPADRIAIVNAQTYQSRQVHDFFGEIGGADFSPDGSTIWVANADEHFGGFMEYDRRRWGRPLGLKQPPNEWVKESDLLEDARCMLNERERQSRFLWNLCEEEHEDLLLY